MVANTSVQAFISNMDDGTVFSIRDIAVDSSYDSIKMQISNICSKGIIIRIMRGIYYKPKFNRLISKPIPYNILDVIHTLARMNNWHIIPSGNACMNAVGLSTQVPSEYVYLSDGPYKKYDIGGKVVEFKHRAPKNLPRSVPAAILVQAIKSKKAEYIGHDSIAAISNYIRNNHFDIDELDNSSMWIRNIIREAYDESF